MTSTEELNKGPAQPVTPVRKPIEIKPEYIPSYIGHCKICNQRSNGTILYHMVLRHAYTLYRSAAKYGTIDVETFKFRMKQMDFKPGTEEFHFMREFIEANSIIDVTEDPPAITKSQRLDPTVANECDSLQEEYVPSEWYKNTEEYKKEQEQKRREQENVQDSQ